MPKSANSSPTRHVPGKNGSGVVEGGGEPTTTEASHAQIGADNTSRPVVDLALSGGGTRAALFSGGALLAVNEAVAASKVEVGAIRSVSGSSLLLARLILAGDDIASDSAAEGRLQATRQNLAELARYGFAPPVWKAVTWSLIAGSAFLGIIMGAPHLADPGSALPVWLGLSVACALGFLGVQAARRDSPFNLRRGQKSGGVFKKPVIAAQNNWFAEDHPPRAGLLPSTDVGFVCTSLITAEPVVINPWTPNLKVDNTGRRVSLSLSAGASAAVPIYSPAVWIGDDLLVDGGALDNLGISPFTQPPSALDSAEPATKDVERDGSRPILIIDSDVPNTAVAQVRDQARFRSEMAHLLLPLGVVVVLAVIWAGSASLTGLNLNFTFTVVVVLAAYLAFIHFAVAFFGRQAVDVWRSFKAEAGAGRAMMRAHRDSWLARLATDGREHRIVALEHCDGLDTSVKRSRHDLKTRLSPVRGDTAVLLVRSGYTEVCDYLGVDQDPKTVEWLRSLESEITPPRYRVRGRDVWAKVRRVAVRCVLGIDFYDSWTPIPESKRR